MAAVRRWIVLGPGLRAFYSEILQVKTLLVAVAWCLLLVLCWPLALLALVLWPLLWILSIPLRLVSITFDGVFALLESILLLPARLFGYKGRSAGRVP